MNARTAATKGRSCAGGSPLDGTSVHKAPDLNRRNCIELATTQTLDSDMAKPAMGGLRWPVADKGIAATLYPNAQTRLPRIVRSVPRDSSIALGMTSRGRQVLGAKDYDDTWHATGNDFAPRDVIAA